MAKTESTAVNELINLVSGETKVRTDDDDLMFRDPVKPGGSIKPPRMSGQVPAMRGAGEVAPLPRSRAPSSTQQNLPPVPPPAARPPVRMMTAPPSHTTIPPLSSSSSRPPAIPMPTRTTRPSIPPPIHARSSAQRPAEGTPPPERISRPTPRPSAVQAAEAPPAPRVSLAQAVVAPARTEAPAVLPVAAPFEPRVAPARDSHPYTALPVAHEAPIDMTSHEPWFEASDGVERLDTPEAYAGTVQVSRPSKLETRNLIGKLIVPMIGLVVAGVFVGGFVAFNGEGGKPHTAAPLVAPAIAPSTEPVASAPAVAPPAEPTPAVAAEPIPAAAVTPPVAAEPAVVPPASAEPAVAVVKPLEPVQQVATPPAPAPAVLGQPKLVDIRIDSRPSGATVMLVDRGRTTFLGTTPMSAAMDPTRAYDVVFTFANKPTQVEHFDPKVTSHLAITLGKPGNTATETPAAKPPHAATPVTEPKHVVARATPAAAEPPRAAPAVEPTHVVAHTAPAAEAPKPVAEKKLVETKVAVAEPAGQGTLMISSKPPCEIYVDGNPTGLSTPQRALPLSAGNHKITLVNAAQNLKKTVAVQITADKPTKLIQNLMAN